MSSIRHSPSTSSSWLHYLAKYYCFSYKASLNQPICYTHPLYQVVEDWIQMHTLIAKLPQCLKKTTYPFFPIFSALHRPLKLWGFCSWCQHLLWYCIYMTMLITSREWNIFNHDFIFLSITLPDDRGDKDPWWFDAVKQRCWGVEMDGGDESVTDCSMRLMNLSIKHLNIQSPPLCWTQIIYRGNFIETRNLLLTPVSPPHSTDSSRNHVNPLFKS